MGRLGMETQVITDHQISSSSFISGKNDTSARLHYETWEEPNDHEACWGSRGVLGQDEYIQVQILNQLTPDYENALFDFLGIPCSGPVSMKMKYYIQYIIDEPKMKIRSHL